MTTLIFPPNHERRCARASLVIACLAALSASGCAETPAPSDAPRRQLTDHSVAAAAGSGAEAFAWLDGSDEPVDLVEVMDLDALPLDEATMLDMQAVGHDLVEVEAPLDLADVIYESEQLDLDDVPEHVLRDLRDLQIEKDVIGEENRGPVGNTRVAPYNSIVKIFTQYAKGGKAYGCTGTMVAPDAVLTAAHCVFKSGRSVTGYPYSTSVVPALYPKSPIPSSGVTYEAPYGTGYGKKVFVPPRYVDNEADKWKKITYDYAVVRLKSSLSSGVRSYGSLSKLLNQPTTIAGYHGDLDKGRVMYESKDQVRKVFDEGIFNHYTDTEGGASGSGITGSGAWANKIFGIHSSGFNMGTPYNSACTITPETHRVISEYVNQVL